MSTKIEFKFNKEKFLFFCHFLKKEGFLPDKFLDVFYLADKLHTIDYGRPIMSSYYEIRGEKFYIPDAKFTIHELLNYNMPENKWNDFKNEYVSNSDIEYVKEAIMHLMIQETKDEIIRIKDTYNGKFVPIEEWTNDDNMIEELKFRAEMS